MRNAVRSLSSSLLAFILLAASCLTIAPLSTAQVTNAGPPSREADLGALARGQGATLKVIVLTEDKRPLDRQSVVKLYNEAKHAAIWQTTSNRSEVDFGDLAFGNYDVEVSVAGYLSARKEIEVVNLFENLQVEIVVQRDSSVVDLDQADLSMSPHAKREIKHAVNALKSGNLEKAEPYLAAAYKLSPSSTLVNFLYGYMFFQKRNFEQAQTYLERTTKLNPRHGQALTLLGRVQLLLAHPDRARLTLEQAVAADPDSWMAHNLLADACLEQHEYEKAREQAQIALDQGHEAATEAQLVLGEALSGLGRIQEALRAWEILLRVSPQSPAALQAQQFVTAAEQRHSEKNKEAVGGPAPSATESTLAVADLTPPPEGWQPMGIDLAQPAVAKGVTCPYEKVIDEAGQRVEQLVNDVGKFAAVEDLLHERLDKTGNPTTRETRKFDYAASISASPEPGVMRVDEYRTQRYGMDDLPDHIADNGFAALALVFHPAMRPDFQMACEGLSDWHGQATWLVHFQQRSDRPNHIQAYFVGSRTYPVNLKGRAWITADRFQIVRIESEMISPVPEIQLLAEHQITEYGPVPFTAKNVELWLPKSAEVYLYFRGRRYYRRHSFEKYMLFSVDSEEKVQEAKHKPHGPGSISPRRRKHWLV